MSLDEILKEQADYYRARASQYDDWFYRRGRFDHGEELNQKWFQEVEQVRQHLRSLDPVESVLELACGTGIWTEELVRIGKHVTALDISEEVIAINRQKLPNANNVEYRLTDLFTWQPDKTYDLVFFGFWLSHVPPKLLNKFLEKVAQAVHPGGRVYLVDSRPHSTSGAKTNPTRHEDIYAIRTLDDGREYKIVKMYYDPLVLQNTFMHYAIDATIRCTESYFLYGDGLKS